MDKAAKKLQKQLMQQVMEAPTMIGSEHELRVARQLAKEYPAFRLYWCRTKEYDRLYVVYDLKKSDKYLSEEEIDELRNFVIKK